MEPVAPGSAPEPESAAPPETIAARFDLFQRAGGLLVPFVTALVAFLIGGLIVAATGYNPLTTYWDISKGAGLNWFGHFHTSTTQYTDAVNFAQTLATATPLILTGLAVAFAFRCGLFNIGGQGQYLVGLIVANWIGTSVAHVARPAHVLLAIVLATLAGAIWAGIAGFLKAAVGAHEVISTIMLNWVAVYMGAWAFGQGGPLQGTQPSSPISAPIDSSAVMPYFWGDPLGGVHIGFFVAIAALVVFWAVLNRTTVGYEVRAVGFNPDAAAYGGISVRKNYIRAMAISGAFAGLAGAMDMLGPFAPLGYGTLDVYGSSIGFLGIAVALLGRNTAVGTGLAALLFGALLYGTTHGLASSEIPAQLTGNLTLIIQGLVVLFVGADVLILYLWNARRKLRRARRPVTSS